MQIKAVIYTQYGPPEVLRLTDLAKPVPKDNEVLIKVHATTVSSADVRLRKADPFLVRLFFGLARPKKTNILGADIAGVVEETGKDVSLFKTGDRVFGSTFDYGSGGYAEYKCLPEYAVLAPMPENLGFAQAAAVFFGAHTALQFLKKGGIRAGQSVLIYGASGSLGTYAVQLAKYFGAYVTGVCSTANLAMVKSLGADRVIDYTVEDFTKRSGYYDIVFDTVGKSPFGGSVRALKPKGVYLRSVHMSPLPLIKGLWVSITSGKKVIGGTTVELKEDLLFLKELIEEGSLTPVIDREYPLEKIAEAHRYVEKGHKRGNVVITIV